MFGIKVPEKILSVETAPGASYINISPFSFCWFTRIEVRATAGDNEKKQAEIRTMAQAALDHFNADRLVEGRELLVLTIEKMVKE